MGGAHGCGLLEFILEDPLPHQVFAELQVFYAGGRDESLEAVQTKLDSTHLTLLDLCQEVNEVAEIASSSVTCG